MSNESNIVYVEGLVQNPAMLNTPDGQAGQDNLGKQNEQLVAEIHGAQFTAALRGNLFKANVTAVTVPVVASGLVSVFSLYNPANSGKVLELIDFDWGELSATTVIDVLGLYWQGAPVSGQATFTTPGVFGTNVFGGSPGRGQPSGIFYSAVTHLTGTTPVRIEILAAQNTTSGVMNGVPCHYEFKGKTVLFPGDLVSVAGSTAALHASTTDLSMSWSEWPYPN
jgi:hypothetical protein